MNSISGPGVYIDLQADPNAALAGIDAATRGVEQAGARVRSSIVSDWNGATKAVQSYVGVISKAAGVAGQIIGIAEAVRQVYEYHEQVFGDGGAQADAWINTLSVGASDVARNLESVRAKIAGVESELAYAIENSLDPRGRSRDTIQGELDRLRSAERGLSDQARAQRIRKEEEADKKIAAARHAQELAGYERRKDLMLDLYEDELGLADENAKAEGESRLRYARERLAIERQLGKETDREVRDQLAKRYDLTFKLEEKAIADMGRKRREDAEKTAKAIADAMDKALAKSLDDFRDGLTEATRKGVENGLSKVNTTLTNLRQILDIQRNAAGPVVRRLG